MTFLHPSQSFDLVVLDANLFRAARDPYTKPVHKTASLFIIAVLICHEIAHILEFCCIRKRGLLPSREPFGTPPEDTCAKAGISWEQRTLGEWFSLFVTTSWICELFLGFRLNLWLGTNQHPVRIIILVPRIKFRPVHGPIVLASNPGVESHLNCFHKALEDHNPVTYSSVEKRAGTPLSHILYLYFC